MSTSPSKPEPLVEPLTGREAEVLRLLTAGLSNQQIAERLYLSEGTVKTHTHNLYGKLGVQSRTRAIARAKDLNLI
jgi:ATP/maltotriose-dependent transcriptional regulator MalT